jgi:putative Mg2+ transporter-C (MgtC) family protein
MTLGEPHRISTLAHILLTASTTRRLLMACALGGAVGLEREWRHKDSGLRTNMLICMGASLFTIMSAVLAGDGTADKSRVASNIVQGIGFLGAGLILHTKSRVLGLTSAATVFVVAAIGMTCGAGLYLEALFATAIVLISLQTIGALEGKIGWKRYPLLYEVRADVGSGLQKQALSPAEADTLAEERETARHRMFTAILKVLDDAGQRLQVIDRDNVAGLERVSFSVMATRQTHDRVLHELRASDATDKVVVFRDPDEE